MIRYAKTLYSLRSIRHLRPFSSAVEPQTVETIESAHFRTNVENPVIFIYHVYDFL